MKCRRRFFLGSLIVLLGLLACQGPSWSQEEDAAHSSSSNADILRGNQGQDNLSRQKAEHQVAPNMQKTPDSGPDTQKLIQEVERALQKAKDEPKESSGAFVLPAAQGVSLQTQAVPSARQTPSGISASIPQNTAQPSAMSQAVTVEDAEDDSEPAQETNGEEPASVLLEAFVDKSTVTIGEQIKYSIVVDAEKNIQVKFPEFGENLGGFGVKDFNVSEPKKSGRNRVKREQWYLLDSYTVGSYVIPPQSVRVTLKDGKTKTLTSPEIFVEVKSVLGDGAHEAGLRDIKDPLEIPVNTKLVFMIGIGVVVALALAGLLGWMIYTQRMKRQKTAPSLPAHEVAYLELKRIENLDLIKKAQAKEYYYLVSNCLRTYLENRFSLRAPEQTTEEFLESVSQGDALEGRHINLLKDYLRHCDLVKYAKLEPDYNQAGELITKTKTFIDETKVVPQESDDLEEVEA